MLILDSLGGFQATVVGSVIGSASLVMITQGMFTRLLDRVGYALYRAF